MNAIDGDLCPLCGDQLAAGDEEAHPECVEEWRRTIEARTCYVCGDPLDGDAEDNSVHPGCEEYAWGPLLGPDPFLDPDRVVDPLRRVDDVGEVP